MPRLVLAPCVEDELWCIWEFIALRDPEAAKRVISAAKASFQRISENPLLGMRRTFKNPKLREVRLLPVNGSENYLIFYTSTDHEVQVLHVYHGARDIEALFDEE
jgi:toxin ParE1/3/4